MSVEDFQINAYVRQVLSRCWVDLAKIRYGSVGSTVYFHGHFEKLRAHSGAENEDWQMHRPEEVAADLALLETVEKEIRRQSTVKDVVFRLDNFKKVQGKWTAAGAGR